MSPWKFAAGAVLLGLSAIAQAGGGQATAHHGSGAQAQFPIPSAITAEHAALHDKLRQLLGAGGKTGSAAREVDTLLQAHFVKEEQYALPPLGALSGLAAGEPPRDAAALVRMTDQLSREMPQMLAEHKKIVAALQRLLEAASAEGRQEGVQFARALAAHATLEEQVLYPSALLVGKYLKEKRK